MNKIEDQVAADFVKDYLEMFKIIDEKYPGPELYTNVYSALVEAYSMGCIDTMKYMRKDLKNEPKKH